MTTTGRKKITRIWPGMKRNERDRIRRHVVEALWQFLFPFKERPGWEKLARIMSVADPWKQFGINRNDPWASYIPTRWELAMAISPKEIAIFSGQVFEPLIPAISNVDSAQGYIREHADAVASGSPIVKIEISGGTISLIDTDIWKLIKLKTHTIVKNKRIIKRSKR